MINGSKTVKIKHNRLLKRRIFLRQTNLNLVKRNCESIFKDTRGAVHFKEIRSTKFYDEQTSNLIGY